MPEQAMQADIAIIGWGKAGKTLAAMMAAQGKSVVMIEQSPEMVGGTCINIGCVPTKALVHDAEVAAAHGSSSGHDFWPEAVARRGALVQKMRGVNQQMLADAEHVTFVSGQASFAGPHELHVRAGEETLTVQAPVIVINTGAVPVKPAIPGADLPMVFDSTGIQTVAVRPQRLLIVGAGPIGLEFASMFANFGSEVTLLNRGVAFLPDEEPEVANAIAEVLTGTGVDIRNDAQVASMRAVGELAEVDMIVAGEETTEMFDAVLLATGRRPATEGLNLDAAGIDTDESGAIVVDDYLHTSAEGIFAVGDVHGGSQQTYLSLDDCRIVADQLKGAQPARSVSDRVAVPFTTFVTPPCASVGLTEQQARSAGHNVLVACQEVAKIKAMPRPKALGDPRGVMKFVVDADTDQILGARLFHVDAQEVINLVSLAMKARITATELRNGIWTHPSSTEALNEVLGQLS